METPKNNLRIEAVGELDELTSFIGLARCEAKNDKTATILHDIQRELFNIGAEIATKDHSILKNNVTPEEWKSAEKLIDELSESFEIPDSFILPGDNPVSAHIHVCRSVCRRLERRVVTLSQTELGSVSEDLMIYINRLSDLFYALARYNEESVEKVIF